LSGTQKLKCAKAPCSSCPYRKDVPSGIWAAEEYDKLPAYDGEMWEQVFKAAIPRFDCHQNDGNLCAGWVGAHGPANLLSLRLLDLEGRLDPSVMDYVSPVPLWASGAEASAHGKRSIPRPGKNARHMIDRLVRKRERKKSNRRK
jgi:hypothetical protein